MVNQVENEIEEKASGESSVVEQKQKSNETAASVSSEAAGIQPAIETTPAEAGMPEPTETATASPAQGQPVPPPLATAADEKAAAETAPTEPPASASANLPASNGIQSEEQSSSEMDFGAILQQFEQEQTIYHAGELVEGKVVGISDRGILVDFNYKSEGVVPLEDFTGPDGEINVKIGDLVEVVIRVIHTGDAPPQLSRIDAQSRKVWADLESAYKEERPITGKVVDKTKGGLKIDLNGIEAFLPGSQIDSRPIRSLDSYIGQEIEAKIIKFSRKRSNIVLSRKVITDEAVSVQKAETLSNIDIGHIVEGTVKNLTEYGAFVDIGGIDGLLHVTDMSWGRLHHPSQMFKPGDHVQVKVLKIDRAKEKVSLGYKQLLPDPWSTVIEVYPVNAKIKGKVSSVTDYGVFVELEPGVEGLVHVSEISWSKRAASPKRLFNKGDEVDVQVLGVDTIEKRISLGTKQFQENPWATVELRYPVGSKVRGKVRNLTDFGAFVELEEGIDGLVHVSDITWAKKVKHPKELLKKDQEVDAIVTHFDKMNQRLSLSMKDLMPSAWESFVASHRPGDIVKGKVSRFTSFGIFVELGEGLEGLCHISELSDERVEKAEDVAKLGQEMEFKILRIEHEDQKIGLSHRAVGKEDEPVVDTKIYSSEAKGGMASLAELANLKFGTTTEESPKQETPKEKKKSKKAAKAESSAVQAEATAPATDASSETEAESEPPAASENVEAVESQPTAAETPEIVPDVEETGEPTKEDSEQKSA